MAAAVAFAAAVTAATAAAFTAAACLDDSLDICLVDATPQSNQLNDSITP
jgi:hypothetical protein